MQRMHFTLFAVTFFFWDHVTIVEKSNERFVYLIVSIAVHAYIRGSESLKTEFISRSNVSVVLPRI